MPGPKVSQVGDHRPVSRHGGRCERRTTGGLVATTTSGCSRTIAARMSLRPVRAQALFGAKASGFTRSTRASGSTDSRPTTAITWARCAANFAAPCSVLISLVVAPAGGLHSTTRQPCCGSTRRRCRQRTLPPPPASSGRCETTSNVRSGTALGYAFASFGPMGTAAGARACVLVSAARRCRSAANAEVRALPRAARLGRDRCFDEAPATTRHATRPSWREIPASAHVVRTRALPLANWLSLVPYRLGLKRVFAYLNWPDGGVGWMPFALAAALRAVRRDRPDVLFSSSAPHGNHLVALLVARFTGIPWVADFRDEWDCDTRISQTSLACSGGCQRVPNERSRRTRQGGRYRRIFPAPRACGRRPATDRDRERCRRGRLSGGGGDGTAAGPVRAAFHVGTLYDLQDPSTALRALAALGARQTVDLERVEVRLVGNVWIPELCAAPRGSGRADRLRRAQACDRRDVRGDRASAVRARVQSCAVRGALRIPGFGQADSLPRQRPDNLATRLVREWNAGVVADPRDEAEIQQALITLWRRWQENGLPDQPEVLPQDARAVLAPQECGAAGSGTR